MNVREFLTTWGFDVDFNTLQKMDAKIGQIRNEAKGLGQNIKEVSAGVRNIGAGLTASVTLPVSLLGGALIKSASDAEETFSKFDTVFSNLKNEANKSADEFGKSFLVSGRKARELLSNTGDLLTGFKFSQQEAFKLSKQVNELAADLASFNNVQGGTEAASAALTKGLLGERESLKTLGIVITEEQVKARVKQLKALGQLQGATELQAKAQATLNLAIEQSPSAIGDVARTSGSFANRIRALTAVIQNAADSFGKKLLPIATKVANKAVVLVEKFNGLSEQTKTLILIFGGIVAVIGPALLIMGLLGQATIALVQGYKYLTAGLAIAKAALFGFNLSALILPATIILIIGLIGLLLEDLLKFATDQPSLIGDILDSWGNFSKGTVFEDIGNWVDWLAAKFGWLGDFISNVWNDLISFPGKLIHGLEELWKVAKKGFKAFEKIGQDIMTTLKPFTDFMEKIHNFATGKVIELFNKFTGEDKRKATVPTRERSWLDIITGSNYGTAAPATVPASTITNANQSKTQNNSINANVNITLPPGSTEDQAAAIRETAKQVYGEEMQKTLNQIPEHD